MKINIRSDRVIIEGYVNAVERVSKPLMSRIGEFIERICKGAFNKALKRNDDVHILLNHDWERDLGSTKKGNLELYEDNIGLHARATIRDADVIKKARDGDLVGWSFGFTDREVERDTEGGKLLRVVRDLDLYEVSILDKSHEPAYEGTLINARDTENGVELRYFGENYIDECICIREEENAVESEKRAENNEAIERPKQPKVENIDYSNYDAMIAEMKGA